MSVKCLIYCSKAKPYLWQERDENNNKLNNFLTSNIFGKKDNFLNGKIVASFDCEKVEKWFWNGWWNCYAKNNDIDIQNIDDEDFEKSCLNFGYLYDYLFENDGYAIHISNLEIFDEPKELAKHTLDNNSDFYIKKWIKKFDSFKGSALTKAPQNMCNVYDRFCNHYVLISIRPEWVCKILNGEKTIEVRKRVIKELKELI